MPGGKSPAGASVELALLYMRQGEPQRALAMLEVLERRASADERIRKAAARCRRMIAERVGMTDERRLEILRLLLARLTGQPAPESAQKPEPEEAVGPPSERERRLEILREMLERLVGTAEA
ncbi:MAG: hypothetical protein D6806_14475 [Deltaproteobacteria bacterium]|nr:MAG: hypothetical protein D6806_14475 [Deltaproteobacteria bacterium]